LTPWPADQFAIRSAVGFDRPEVVKDALSLRHTIPELVQRRTDARLRRYADKHYAGRYSRLEVRFRSQFCYIDAYTEPAEPGPNWPPANWLETREEYMERLRNAPIHLCRL